jgi:hypothetical protein
MVLAGSKPDGSEYTKVSTPPYCGFSAAGLVAVGAVEAVAGTVVATGGVVVVGAVAQDARRSITETNEVKITHTYLPFMGIPPLL